MATTAALLAAALAVSGCATKDFVRDQVAVVDTRVTSVQGTAREALERANAAQRLAEGKFVYQAVLSDDSIKFAANRDELSPEAQARLGELVQRLKAENRNVYIEIREHADAAEGRTGLGQARAESVGAT
jgi:peptidoglycan-associated lipoprotein